MGRRTALLVGPLLAVLIYLPTLRHELVFDDRAVIGENPLLQEIGSLPRLLVTPYWSLPRHAQTLYRPLTMATFALERALGGGLHPARLHLVNVLLHALVTLLVAALALEVLSAPWAAALAATLFAIHPIHVEAVAGLVGRSELLAACGALLAILCHLAALERGAGSRRTVLSTLSWLSAGFGMLAKESAVSAPFLCLAADLALRRGRGGGRRILYGGHAVTMALYLAARCSVLGGLGVGAPIPFIDNPAASAGALDGRLTALSILPRYAGLLLWPRTLSADYSFAQIPVVHTLLDPAVIGGAVILLLTLGGGLALRRRAAAAGFALLFIALSAGVTTNLVLFIGTLMAERLMYLPSAGVCFLAGCLAAAASSPSRRRVAMAAGLAVSAAGAWRTWERLPDWKDDFALYRSASIVSPHSARIRFNLGNAYLRRQEYAAAETNFRLALSIYEAFDDAKVNLAMALLQEGQPREALVLLKAAAGKQPGSADLAINLGTAYQALGTLPMAESEFRRALRLDPNSGRAWNNLGAIDLARGRFSDAVSDLREAVRCEPGYAVFRINLGDALAASGRREDAAREFDLALGLDPLSPEAHRGAGEAALWRGNWESAEREFAIALSGKPPSARAANFMGYLAASRGDDGAAADHYLRAVQLDPNLADAHRSLGLLYVERLGRWDEGVRHLERSLALDPAQADAAQMRRLILEAKRRGR